MRKILLLFTFFAVILVACAAPRITAQTAGNDSTVIFPTSDRASSEEPASVLSRTPIPTAAPQMAPTVSAGFSDAPVSSGIFLTIWGDTSGALHLIDPRTGQDLAGHEPISYGAYTVRGISSDGNQLAAIVYPPNTSGRGGVLHLIDLKTWTDTDTDITANTWAVPPVFSPDGGELAFITYQYADASQLNVVDLTTYTSRTAGLPFQGTQLRYTSSGNSIAVYGTLSENHFTSTNSEVYAALISASDLTIQWQTKLSGVLSGHYVDSHDAQDDPHAGIWWDPGVVFAPDGDLLFVVHADSDRLSTVDFVQRTVSLTTIAPAQTWLDRWMRLTATVAHAKVLNGDSKRVAISPDSSTLYAIGLHTETNDSDGTLQMTETPLGLTVIDATTGIEIALLDTQASDIQLSPDGSELYLVHWEQTDQPSTDVLDTATLALKQTIVGQSLMEVNSIDGAPHYIGTAPFASRTVISTLDTTSWEVTSSWSISGWVEWGLP